MYIKVLAEAGESEGQSAAEFMRGEIRVKDVENWEEII